MKINSTKLINLGFLLSVFVGILGQYIRPIIYIQDIINLFAIYYILKRVNRFKKINSILIPLFVFTIFALVSVMVNGVPLSLLVWGIRNNYKYFVWLIFLSLYLKEGQAKKILSSIKYFISAHIMLTVIQYILGYRMDNLGGIFGTEAGSNSGVIIFLFIILFISMHAYVSKRIKLFQLFFIIVGVFLNAAVSELKALFLVIPMFIVLFALLHKKHLKSAAVVLVLIFTIPIGISTLTYLYPNYANYFTADVLLSKVFTTEASYSGNDMSRTSVLTYAPSLINNWVNTSHAELIGIGLGNGEYSTSIKAFNSTFYKRFGYTHYNWFSTSFLLIETGYLGLISYALIFVSIFIYGFKRYKKEQSLITTIGFYMTAVALFLFVYDASLRTNYGYLIYIFIAFLYIDRSKGESIKNV